MNRNQALATGILAAYAILTAAFWSNTRLALNDEGLTYAERRVVYAFNGLDIEALKTQVDASLPPDARVSLGPNILRSSFMSQRLSEGLYPRRVDRGSPNVIDLAAHESKLELRAAERGITHRSTSDRFDFSLPRFTLAVLSASGFGLVLMLFFGCHVSADRRPGATIVMGALAIGMIMTLATWLQVAVPWVFMAWLGLTATITSTVFLVAKTRHLRIASPRTPEGWFLLALLVLFLAETVVFPVTLWDGRSVWLFAAKKVHFNGMLTKSDLLNPEYQFSNPSYPMLLPSWLSLFSAWGGSYNERMAATGLPVLFAALLSLNWSFLRERFGRWAGAFFAFSLFLMLENLVRGGYADGFLSLCALLAVLALSRPDGLAIGCVALAAAALLKTEGLALGVPIAAIYALREQRRRFIPVVALLPALLHRAWTMTIGVKNVFQETSASFGLWTERLGELFALLPTLFAVEGYTRVRFVSRAGFVALLVALMALAWSRRSFRSSSIDPTITRFGIEALALCAAAFSACVVAVMTVPFDVPWFFGVTVDRLLIHPSIFAMLAAVSLISDGRKRSNL